MVKGPVTDSQITSVAVAQGWKGREVERLETLTMMETFTLGKHMLEQGKKEGFTVEQMSRM